jgi:crossover junction endodeoxyribonuclease RuvC
MIIGIDPGLDGAIAILTAQGVELFDTPTVTVKKSSGKGTKREYDVSAMRVILDGRQNHMVVIEKSQAFPDQGAVSNFSTGHGYGLWRGLIVGLGLGYEAVSPRTWKKAMGLDSDKKRSILLAKQLFPATADQYKLPRGRVDSLDGRAEALLMAEWMRRRLSN